MASSILTARQNISLTPRGVAEIVANLRSRKSDVLEICRVSGVVGASLAVIHGGKTIYEENFGFGDLDRGKKVTCDTIFHIASLTKAFTAACINRLRVEGKLALDDLVQKHLPGIVFDVPDIATTVTIADLLAHRTGLQKADNIWLGSEGEVLLNENQICSLFGQLELQAVPRTRFGYNNICYAVLGEVISTLSGQPYEAYLHDKILQPLGMTRTLVTKHRDLPDDTSLAYGAWSNHEHCNVPLPKFDASTTMGSAGGLLSTVSDLSTYYKALMRSWTVEQTGIRDPGLVDEKNLDAIGNTSFLFAPLQPMHSSHGKKSYAAGWVRSQLPGQVGDIGTNPRLVAKMPVLASRLSDEVLALWHQGSLVGATSFVMLLPETESAVIVLTNTMALNDAADWIGQLLVETLLGVPGSNDYVVLATRSAEETLVQYGELSSQIDQGKSHDGPKRPIVDYVGSYKGIGGIFCIDVVEQNTGLDILFQGRESQRYQLEHHHGDAFTWFMSFEEQIKRAQFPVFDANFYLIQFSGEEGKGITNLRWIHDAAMPAGDVFVKQGPGNA